jgi:hypothetical protein
MIDYKPTYFGDKSDIIKANILKALPTHNAIDIPL